MDSEKLITLVQERKSLWDQKETNYHVRSVQKALWQQVSKEINEPVEALKKRWRGLRDTFRKELKKEINSKSGADDSQRSSWPFFRQLYFLADTIQLGHTESGVPPAEEEEESLSDSLHEHQCHSTAPQCTALATPWAQGEVFGDNHETSKSKAKKSIKSPLIKKMKFSRDQSSRNEDRFLELESRKANCCEEGGQQNKYGDKQFLDSLLPFLTDIPKNRKLIARTNIMKVIIEELNRKESSHDNYPLSHTSVSTNAPNTPASTIFADSDENSADCFP
ncbi:unnamed protein product [Nezara viridula]|uniref:MADF domain-containing protein n=1 Tax=Nezara viridula TaxID=85310 RepID=A0A9P0H6J3_NEZVI|nr:unnamed protein product [Nezara viridula]